MNRKVIITNLEEKILISLFEESNLVEFRCYDQGLDFYGIGTIHLGRVKRVIRGIGAAFIEIKEGFECYYSLEKATHPVQVGQSILVQINKEAMKTKVPTVTDHVQIKGEYLILTIKNTTLGMSGKLKNKRKKELQEWLMPYKNSEYGFIVRTKAQVVEKKELIEEAEFLIKKYKEIMAEAKNSLTTRKFQRNTPSYILELLDLEKGGLEIIIESKQLFHEVNEYFNENGKEIYNMPILYEDKEISLNTIYRVNHILKEATRKKVWLQSGGYLVIEQTEALVSIDVNTGKNIYKKDQDKLDLKINLEAAKEVARQIRLRNLSGIIIVDFVNMYIEKNINELLSVFRNYLEKDPIPTELVDMTKLQLVEITRKRVKRTLLEQIG